MGNSSINAALQADIAEMTGGCFQNEEITKLLTRFSELCPKDKDGDKQASPDDLVPVKKVLKLHEFQPLGLTPMVLKIMEPNDDKITFKQFVEIVWIFCSSSSPCLKQKWFSRCLTTTTKTGEIVDENKMFAFFQTQLQPNFQDDFILQLCKNILSKGSNLKDCFSKQDISHHMTGDF